MNIRRLYDIARDKGNRLSLFWKYVLLGKLSGPFESKKVILLRLDLLGDCAMFSDAAATIRDFYRDREMTVVCLPLTKPLFERMGIFDEVIALDFRPGGLDFGHLRASIQRIRQDEYDILLQPQISRLPEADILAAAVRCNLRIAIEPKMDNCSPKWARMVRFLYDGYIPAPRGWTHEFENYAAFIRGLGVKGYKTRRPSLPYGPQTFVAGDYYILFPGGSFAQKNWPPECFAKLADHIYLRTGLTGVILGVASEQWISDRIKEAVKPQTKMALIDLVGQTSVADVIDIVGNSLFVVTNDTSAAHIACATNTPCVAAVGGGNLHRFLPYQLESVLPEDRLPLAAYQVTACSHCAWSWKTIGERNPECLLRMVSGSPTICMENLPCESMEALVDQVIGNEHLQGYMYRSERKHEITRKR